MITEILDTFCATVKAEKMMSMLDIDTPDLSVQYEAMLTDLKRNDVALYQIENSLHNIDCSDQMEWIKGIWETIAIKQYEVTVTEILERTIKVTAASKTEAEEKVRDMYDRQEVILDWSDFVDVNYNTVELETEND